MQFRVQRLACSLSLVFAACSSGPDLAQLDHIRALESSRSGLDELIALTRDDDPIVRRAACEALGTLATPGSESALTTCSADADPHVALAAVFALGCMPDAGDCSALSQAMDSSSSNMRLLAARALGFRRAAGALDLLLIAGTDDSSPPVRAAALTAVAALSSARSGERALDSEACGRVATTLGARLAEEEVPVARAALAYALYECAHPASADAARGELAKPTTAIDRPDLRWTRVFLLRSLSAAGVATEAELIDLVSDKDPQVALAALTGLSKLAPESRSAAMSASLIRAATNGDTAHVRARAITLLGELGGDSAMLTAVIDHAAKDASPSVRRAAIATHARLAPATAEAAIALMLESRDPFDRAAATRAAALLPTALASPLLSRAFSDATAAVRAEAVAAFGQHAELPDLDELLARAAADRDVAVREELANALTALAPGHGELARTAFLDRPDSSFADARQGLLTAVVACDPRASDLDEFLGSALTDLDLAVRRRAAQLLTTRGASAPSFDAVDHSAFPRVGVEVPIEFLAARPRIEFDMPLGKFVAALAPALAPVHCWNLCQLAAGQALTGTPFHRVVADFVVQGGDKRGDGFGNSSWLGGTLRRELGPLPFLAGTLGMPRSSEIDSGGGQFFITLGSTPWLDGQYTAFGRVIEGLDVVENLEQGDRILECRVRFD